MEPVHSKELREFAAFLIVLLHSYHRVVARA